MKTNYLLRFSFILLLITGCNSKHSPQCKGNGSQGNVVKLQKDGKIKPEITLAP